MNESPQIQVPTAKGLNTYAARGSTDAPRVLRNALLRPGGWECAPAARPHLPGVTFALWAGWGRDLYVQQGGIVGRYRGGAFSALPTPAGLSLPAGVTLGPNLVQAGDHYLSEQGVTSTRSTLPPFTQWVEGQAMPTGPWWRVQNGESPGAYRWLFVPVRGPEAVGPPGPALWPTEITLPHGPYAGITFGGLTGHFNIYFYAPANYFGGADEVPFAFAEGWKYMATTANPQDNTLTTGATVPTSPKTEVYITDAVSAAPRTAEYHLGRVYAAMTAAQRLDPGTGATTALPTPENRLYYSDVVADFRENVRPYWTSDGYLDIPFRVSYSIVGLKSVGRHLYIFGDNEVMLLNGNDDDTWAIDPLGDSLGAVAPGSIQSVGQAVLWLSDSGVMLAQQGQLADVGADVRDLLLGLDRAQVSSTVDYARELYLITDGVTTLAYQLREQGWSQRTPDGAEQRLLFGGGTPWSLHAGGLHSLDSADLLPLTLTVGPFGTWGTVQTWRGAQVGTDSDLGGTLTARLDARMVGMDVQAEDLPGQARTRTVRGGLVPASVSLATQHGVLPSGELAELTVTLTPAPGARRCLLRPPLLLLSSVQREAIA